MSILRFSCFNFHSILYRFNDLLYRLNEIISRLNEIFVVLIFRSNFLVSISFLINIGKEMSLPAFCRILVISLLLLFFFFFFFVCLFKYFQRETVFVTSCQLKVNVLLGE